MTTNSIPLPPSSNDLDALLIFLAPTMKQNAKKRFKKEVKAARRRKRKAILSIFSLKT